MSSTPGRPIGSTSRPRTVRPRRRRRLEQRQRGAVDGVVAAQPEGDAADVGLVGEPDGVELERHRPADPPRDGHGGRGIGHGRSPRSPRSRRRPRAPGSRARTGPPAGGRPAGSGSGRRRTRSGPAASAGQPVRHGPRSIRARMACLPAGDLGDRPERLERAAQERGAATVGRRAAPSSRAAARPRSATRRPAGSRGGPRSRRGAPPVTSLAVATSDGSERYGKSWTRTRTS